ncbi:MAG: hypothetical protein ACOC47_00095 [Alkalispirochaetaceae bacterium]
MDRSYALLLLFVRLKQVETAESALRVFAGALSELWPGLRFAVDRGDSADASGDRFPLATTGRRYGELVIHSENGAESLSAEERGLIFNAVELLQLLLENREKGEEMEELKLAVQEGVRRRGLATLELLQQLISIHANTEGGGELPQTLSLRLRWLEVLDRVLLELKQHGDQMSAGELETVVSSLLARSLTPEPQRSSGFATVESVDVQVGVERGRFAALLLRELVEGVRLSLWNEMDAMDIALNFAGHGNTLSLSLTLGLGATEGSPRSLSELNRRLARLFAEKGGLEFEESWEWGAVRFTVRMAAH